jgi:hypothetical protein
VTQPSAEVARPTIWPRVAIVLVFAGLGPLIGGPIACTGLFAGVGVASLPDLSPLRGIAAAFALCLIYGPLFGYFFGLVPAALTGVALAILKPRPRRGDLRQATLIATGVSAVHALVMFSARLLELTDGAGTGSIVFATLIVFAGAIAGALCWLILSAIFERRGDKSPGPAGATTPAP